MNTVIRSLLVGSPAMLGLAALSLVGCTGDSGTISVRLITPPGSAVLDDIVTARLSLDEPPTEVISTRGSDGQFTLSLDVVADGQDGLLSFEGRDDSDRVIAVGKSGRLPISAITAEISIFVAAPDSLELAQARLEPPRSEFGAATVSFGVMMAGGRTSNGAATDEVQIYSVYQHALEPEPDNLRAVLPEPRVAPIVMGGAAGLAYVFGGLDEMGQRSGMAWRYDTSVPPVGFFSEMLVDQPAALARSGERAAPLDTQSFIVTGDPPVVIDGFNEFVQGLSSRPGVSGTATTAVHDSVVFTLFAGLGNGDSGGYLLSSGNLVELSEPQLARTGHETVLLLDQTMLVIGGRLNGVLATTAVRLDPSTPEPTFTIIEDFLRTPRRDAAITSTSKYIVVAGGIDDMNMLVPDVELFDVETLDRVTTLTLTQPRRNATAAPLSNGQVVIIGGTDENDAPIELIELFTPAL